jgi:hypothetical protein
MRTYYCHERREVVHEPDDLRAAVVAAEESWCIVQGWEAEDVAAKKKNRSDAFRQAVKADFEGALRPRDRCRCCGRELTDPPSVARGIGPECWPRLLSHCDDLKRREPGNP